MGNYPDDLQVWIYKGTPQRLIGKPELVWVRLSSCAEDTCVGRMLNEPFHIKSMHEGDLVEFGKGGRPDQFLVMTPRVAQ